MLTFDLRVFQAVEMFHRIASKYTGLRYGESFRRLLESMQGDEGGVLVAARELSIAISRSWNKKVLITCCTLTEIDGKRFIRIQWSVDRKDLDGEHETINLEWVGMYRMTIHRGLPELVAGMCYKEGLGDTRVEFQGRLNKVSLRAVNIWLAMGCAGLDGGVYLDQSEDGVI